MSLIIPRNFKRAKAQDAQFKIGDTVKLSKSHPRNPGKEGKVVQVFPTGFVKVKFDDGSTDIELVKNVTADSRAGDVNFKVGDKVKVPDGKVGTVEKIVTFGGVTDYLIRVPGRSIESRRAEELVAAAGDSNDDSILRLCKPSNVIKKAKMGNLHEVRYGAGYIYPFVGHDKVLLKVFNSLSEANRSPLMNS